MLTASFASLLVGALAVSADPVIRVTSPFNSLPIIHKIRTTTFRNVYTHDLARAHYLNFAKSGLPMAKVVNTPATNDIGSYFAEIGVGNPVYNHTLLIDTASSNTWIGGTVTYRQTSTSTNTHDGVSVFYESGSFTGTEFIDRVTIGQGLVIEKQSIGVATKTVTFGFSGVDGILGFGPTGLTRGTLQSGKLIPTVVDNLSNCGAIGNNTFAISFLPTNAEVSQNGEISWGGVDHSKYTGKIIYAPVTDAYPSSEFWGIDQMITYGTDEKTILGPNSPGIIDTGTTLILLSSTALANYQNATGATFDPATTLLTIPATNFQNLQSLYFKIKGATFELTPDAQAFPRALNTAFGGICDNVYLVISSLDDQGGPGLQFINGYFFMERFYTVYYNDTKKKKRWVGIANTTHTHDVVNKPPEPCPTV